MPELSVVIVSWNTSALLSRCLDALDDARNGRDVEVIVVDNGSTDDTLAVLARRRQPPIVVANTENAGFAIANNQGLERATAPIVLLLNSDAFVPRGTLDSALACFAANPRVGILGVTVLNEDGTLQAAAGSFPTLGSDLAASVGYDRLIGQRGPSASAPHPVDWVHGSCMFVRRAAFTTTGGLDSRFFMYSEEVDWCYRMWRAGWEVWLVPDATVVHVGGASSRNNDVRRRTALYRSRLGLRRRMGGAPASILLWCGMLAGLAGRILLRGGARCVTRRAVGRQTAASDWALLRAVARMDPLARWITS